MKRINALAGNVIFVAVAASVAREQGGRRAGIDFGAVQAMIFLLVVTFQAATVIIMISRSKRQRTNIQHGLRHRFNDHRGAESVCMAGHESARLQRDVHVTGAQRRMDNGEFVLRKSESCEQCAEI